MKTVLHVGCGPSRLDNLPPMFQQGWREIRLDIDPQAEPDIVADITDMHAVASGSVDAVYSSHNLEHLYAHQVPLALAEFHRVLAPEGLLMVTLPDLQAVAGAVAEGRLEETLYESPMGPIAPLDVLYGFRRAIAEGREAWAHKTGFTAATLSRCITAAGFHLLDLNRHDLALWAVAKKPGQPPRTSSTDR